MWFAYEHLLYIYSIYLGYYVVIDKTNEIPQNIKLYKTFSGSSMIPITTAFIFGAPLKIKI